MALLPLPGRVYSWAWLDDCGDAFEGVLAALAPGDVAACRLVSRAWRREVDLLLQQLAPAPGSEPAAVVATFPHLTSLRLTAGSTTASSGSSPTSSGSNPTSTGSSPTSTGSSGGSNASCVRLPPLGALVSLRRLRTLSLIGPAPAGSQLDCCSLLPLSGAPPALAALELSGLRLRHAAALQQMTQLTCLHLAGSGALSGWPRSLPALLAPLRRLSHLHFSCTALPSAAALGPADPVAAAAAAAEDAAVAAAVAAPGLVDALAPPGTAGLLDGLSDLTTLVSLELCCHDGGSEAAVAEIAALPRLRRLSISRCASFGAGAPSVSDASLALLSRTLGHQLSSLTLTGHHGIGDEGLHAVARCGVLRHLDLRLGAPGIPTGAGIASDAGVRALAALSSLGSLHLGGAVALGEAGCAALAASLGGRLTSLQLSSCASLADPALFRLAPLAPGLRRLGLCSCEGVTDIGLAALLRGATRLSHLELAGCHRNITGIGLQVGGLRRLRHLDLAGCDAITDHQIEALLPAARSLEHLNLRDCSVSDHACYLLAAASPNLRWLSLEHCPGVSDEGLRHLAAGLPLLQELRLYGSGVSPGAAALVMGRALHGRQLKLGVKKPCWWVQGAVGRAAAPAPVSLAAAAL